MAFQGSLSELPLPDIIQLVSVSGKTGRFTLTGEDRSGRIYLRNGQIVHASVAPRSEPTGGSDLDESRETTGEDAIYELATWSNGDFVFEPDEASPAETIDKPNTNLLMEAARRMDEWQVLRKKIASTSMVPVFTDLSATAAVSLSPREWAIVRNVDGRRSIDEVALALGESSFNTSKDVYGLLAAGHLELSEPVTTQLRGALRKLSPAAGGSLAEALDRAARSLYAGEEAATTFERAAKLAQTQISNGRVTDGIVDLLNDHERVLRRFAGPDTPSEYRKRLKSLLGIE